MRAKKRPMARIPFEIEFAVSQATDLSRRVDVDVDVDVDVSNSAPGAPGFLETSKELNMPMTDVAFSPAEECFLVS